MTRSIACVALVVVAATPARADDPPSALAPPSEAQIRAPTGVELHTRSARRAARSGDCLTVDWLAKVVAEDAAYYRDVFARDPDIAACLHRPPPPPPPDPRHHGPGLRAGVGVGPIYGGLGALGAVGAPYVEAIAGAGYLDGAFGWSAGVRGYARDRFAWLRPHLTAVFGATAVYRDLEWNGLTWETHVHALYGFAVIVGADVQIGSRGWPEISVGVGAIRTLSLPVAVADEAKLRPCVAIGIDHTW